jgi:hypothetical protein
MINLSLEFDNVEIVWASFKINCIHVLIPLLKSHCFSPNPIRSPFLSHHNKDQSKVKLSLCLTKYHNIKAYSEIKYRTTKAYYVLN